MAKKKAILPKASVNAVNEMLVELEGVQQRVAELQAEKEKTATAIRSAFKKAVVVFIDMVGSTQYKVEHVDKPEVWIQRVYLFSEVIAQYVESLGGRVVKYIGDEVMAVFDGDSCVNEASSLVARIDEIEQKLKSVIGVETRVKIALDCGDVCFLKFEGHDEIDPQGTAVDRCARIAKHTKPGAVLASHEFVKDCPNTFHWVEAGSVELKGIGTTVVYQMGEVTVDLSPVREIRDDEYRKLNERMAELEKTVQQSELEAKQLCEMNEGLQEQIRKLGKEPAEENSVTYEEEEEGATPWDKIEGDLEELRGLIDKAPAPSKQYARFLFLEQSGDGDSYNIYERKFDECIEAKLVENVTDSFYRLDEDHPRNKAAKKVLCRLSEKLYKYERDDEGEELFNYQLDDPEFWHRKIGYYVL